jgi:hypothetical protein
MGKVDSEKSETEAYIDYFLAHWGIIFVLCIIFITSIFIGLRYGMTLVGVVGLVLMVVLVNMFYTLAGRKVLEGEIKDMQSVASELGFSFAQSIPATSFGEKIFLISEKKDALSFTNVMSGECEGFKLRAGDMTYYYKGKEITSRTMPFIAITTLCNFSDMLILSKKDYFQNTFYADKVFSVEEVALEGNFQKHFGVNVRRGDEVILREFLTPDVMEFLVQKCAYYNIIMLDHTVFIFPDYNVDIGFTRKTFLENLDMTKILLTKWKRLLEGV